MSSFKALAEQLKEDLQANRRHPKGVVIVLMFRIASHFRQPASAPARKWARPLGIIYMLITDWLLGFEMPWNTQVGRRLRVWHAHGTVISPSARLGDDVLIRQGVTIGNDGTSLDLAPVIGNRVQLGAGAVVLGGVIVGDDAIIGANAVVVKDVPAGTTVVGIPARPIGSL